jgi:hypothetical protein
MQWMVVAETRLEDQLPKYQTRLDSVLVELLLSKLLLVSEVLLHQLRSFWRLYTSYTWTNRDRTNCIVKLYCCTNGTFDIQLSWFQ